MIKEIYNYIFGYIEIKCTKCEKPITLATKYYCYNLSYYCSNKCGYNFSSK